jgi:hypothetical protein
MESRPPAKACCSLPQKTKPPGGKTGGCFDVDSCWRLLGKRWSLILP